MFRTVTASEHCCSLVQVRASESTSNLDSLSETLAKEAINKMARDCTLVIVAHRLATVIDADVIMVFDCGRLVASGTHEQLLDSSALYQDLTRYQLLV